MDRTDFRLQVYAHEQIIRLRPSLLSMDQDLLEVVVRDVAGRYDTNADKWGGFAQFLANYAETIESLTSQYLPDNGSAAEMWTMWAKLLNALNTR